MIPSGTHPSPPAHRARETRRQAFVLAARDAFFARGYGATTMSSIAAAVGGSKTTLWAHFPSKEDLFAAVIDDIVDRFSEALRVDLHPSAAVEPTLRRFAGALMDTLLAGPILSLHRVVTGEAQRFPQLGALLYERGPRRGKARLAAFFATAMTDGRLRPGDPLVAARQFIAMCQSGCFQERLLGITGYHDAEEVARDIDTSIDTFMRAWGSP